jgi:uncharacterized protein HemX
MKNVVLKIKNLLLGSLRTLEKHQVTVYASIILTIFFVSFWTLQKVNHAKEMAQIKKENISLRGALSESDKAIEDSWEVIQLQAKTLQKYENIVDRAQNALNTQARFINDLVEYLKKIKHWPPKEPRPESDPSKWITFTKE